MANDLAVQVAVTLAKRFEGCRLRPYLCPAGVASIGYGATRYPGGLRVELTDPPITPSIANEMLLHSVQNTYLPAVLKLCPGIDSPERLAAIIDFTFNLGSGHLKASTLRRRINAGRWGDVPKELRKWTKVGGRVLAGLVRRRDAESRLITGNQS